MPKVSVSIITYNQAPFVAEAIESVLAQETDFDVEILIGDDCSTDGTQEILTTYQASYPDRIFLRLHPEKGAGVPGRINNVTNLRACRGRFVAMLDGDDFWCDRGKLKRQVSLLEARPEISACAHDSAIFDQVLGRRRRKSFYERNMGRPAPERIEFGQANLMTPLLFQTSSFCFRRSMLDPFPDWFMEVPAADAALFLILAGKGPILYEGRISSVYRMHGKSVISRLSRSERSRFVTESWDYFFEHVPATRTRKGRANRALQGAVAAGGEGRLLSALRHLASVVAYHPPVLAQAARRLLSD
jgi:glycosyltransferase involved in cell wall biosynthesis